MPKPPLRVRGQWSLIGLLLALAIVMILAAIYMPQVASVHSKPGQPRTPIERGYGAACSEYTGQFNQAITLYKMDHDDHPPSDIQELKKYGVTDDMIHSNGCYFVMDPSTGTVVDKGLSQARPQAAPPSYYAPSPINNASPVPSGSNDSTDDGGSSGITPNTNPSNGQSGPGGIKIPNIPTSGM